MLLNLVAELRAPGFVVSPRGRSVPLANFCVVVFGSCLSRLFQVLGIFQVVSLAASTTEETFVNCSRGILDKVFVNCSPSILDEPTVTCSLCTTEYKFGTCLIGSSYSLVTEDGNRLRFIFDETYGSINQLHLEKNRGCEGESTSKAFLTPRDKGIPCFEGSTTSLKRATTMAQGSSAPTGIPLQEYRKDVPPGWMPGLPDYPLRLYLERVKMWYRLYDGMDETVGPLLAGRLGGRAQKIALSLRLRDPLGNIDVGDAALVRLAVDEVRDPMNPAVIIQEHIVSGVQALFNALIDAFGEGDQLRATQSLENFFDFRRGRLSLAEYSAEWTMRLEEAITHAGLDINAVARTFLYFRGSQLPQRHVDDILMQIHGDLSRFQEARTLALRLAHRQNLDHQANFEQTEHHYIGEADDWSWPDESWSDQSAWYAGEWPDYEEYYDVYDGDEYYDIGDSWPEDFTTEGNEANTTTNEATDDTPDQNTYYKKNVGLGCTICGSKWHESGVCPMSSTNYGKGKGKSKYGSFGKGKGKHWKGKGKGKGKKGFRPWRSRPFGKGKGYGRSFYDDFENEADGGYWSNDYFISGQERALLQLHHARTGLQVDMEQKTSAGNLSKTVTDPPTKKAYDEVFSFGKKITAAASSSGEKNEASAKVTKTLSLPVIHEQSTVYHQVRGQKRRGLLVDPGAGAGIVGSETLRDILENIPYLKDRPEVIEWTSRSTSVTGISGQGDATLAHVTFPFHLTKDLLGSFSADVLGNEGSLCPALLPNPSLRRLHAGVLTEWFENGDGLLVFGEPSEVGDSSRVITLRILLTETGHYILPVDQQPEEIVEEAQAKVIMFMTSVCQQSTSTWNDVHEKNIKLYCNKSLSRTSLVEPEQGERHALPKQDLKKNESKDHWKLDDQQGTLTRVHVRPRLNLFVPQDDHCPVSVASLKLTRTTTATFADGSLITKEDEWQQEDRNTQLHDRWTGVTVFHLGEEVEHH